MRRRYYRRKKGIAKKEKPFFRESSSSIQTKEEKRPFFQAKGSEGLTVGQPGDKYEVEADAMADAVMSNSPKSAEIQRKEITGIQRAAEEEEVQTKIQRQTQEEEPAIQTQDAEEEEPIQMKAEEEEIQMHVDEEEVQMQSEEEEVQMQSEEEEVQMQTEEEEPSVQAKAQGKPKASNNLSHRIKQSSGNGQALAPKAKQKMETAFGVDFGTVNIHTNSEAIQMNKELHSQAFAHGNDVYFNQGKYQPETNVGQHLLAHELTHVIQQTGMVQRQPNNDPSLNSVLLPEKDEFLPGYTQCDFLDERIAHHAQWALYTLYKRGGTQRGDAISMLGAVKNGMMQGIFKEDYGIPAKVAQRHGMGWWQLIPKGSGAFVFEPEQPPMMVYKNNVANDRNVLADALLAAWENSSFASKAIIVPSPSLEPCPLAPKPEPEKKPKPEDGCPPGMVLDKERDLCILPVPVDSECTEAEMGSEFQKQQDFCASIKSSIDLLCSLPNVCDLGGPPAKLACELYKKTFGKPFPGSEAPECSEPRAKFYEKCTISSVIGNKDNMNCFPGTAEQIRNKYHKWPGRIK